MRRHGIVIESSGNLQVSWKQDTYYLEIKEDLSKCFPLKKKLSAKISIASTVKLIHLKK